MRDEELAAVQARLDDDIAVCRDLDHPGRGVLAVSAIRIDEQHQVAAAHAALLVELGKRTVGFRIARLAVVGRRNRAQSTRGRSPSRTAAL